MGTLLIPGICAVISEKPLEIRSTVFMRDTIFFLLSLLGLVIFIVDGTIYGLEAIYLLIIFVGYVVCICLSPLVKRSFRFNREVCIADSRRCIGAGRDELGADVCGRYGRRYGIW